MNLPLREWLDQADDPAFRAWLHVRNGPNPLTGSTTYLIVRNMLSTADQDVLEALLCRVAREAFELGRA